MSNQIQIIIKIIKLKTKNPEPEPKPDPEKEKEKEKESEQNEDKETSQEPTVDNQKEPEKERIIMGKYFGTDGVRGVANKELTPELAFKIGRFGGYVLTKDTDRPKVIIGRDTRISGHMLEGALVAGLLSTGAEVMRLGVISTPGVAYLTKALDAQAGVMISASHNPVQDNGIKFFGSDGFKLTDEQEAEIEALLDKRSG